MKSDLCRNTVLHPATLNDFKTPMHNLNMWFEASHASSPFLVADSARFGVSDSFLAPGYIQLGLLAIHGHPSKNYKNNIPASEKG